MIEQGNMKKYIDQELDVLNKVRHRNIVNFMDIIHTKSAYYLVFELCEGGNFQEYLKARGALPEYEA